MNEIESQIENTALLLAYSLRKTLRSVMIEEGLRPEHIETMMKKVAQAFLIQEELK